MKKINQNGFTLAEGLLIVIVLSLLVGVGYYVYSVNNPRQKTESTMLKPKEEKKAETKAPQIPELVEYPKDITIQSKQDIVKLTNTSDSFKSFIGSLVGDEPRNEQGCDSPMTITVRKIYKDQFALGAINACGGAAIVWKKTVNTWAQVLALQQGPSCSVLKENSIPHQIIEKCFDESSEQVIANTI